MLSFPTEKPLSGGSSADVIPRGGPDEDLHFAEVRETIGPDQTKPPRIVAIGLPVERKADTQVVENYEETS
jgi:hypothetical protein